MKIALVFPRSTFLSNPIVWPTLGLMYLSSQLQAQGCTTHFFDLNFSDIPKDGEFDQLWLSTTSSQMWESKRIGELTRNWKITKTVLGGTGAWANPETHKTLPYNLIVAGEADHPENIKRIVELAQTARGELISLPISRNLDWVLPPDRRWSLNYHSYMTSKSGKRHRMTSMFTVRGCPMECAFCASGRNGTIWASLTRYEPLDIVERQIAECARLGFTGLSYYDDIFILNRERTLAMLEMHRRHGMVFRCFLRSDILHKHGGKEYLQELKEGGLIEIFVGVESADNEIKKNIHKGTTIEQDTAILEWCRELGITCKMSFILGLPSESRESMECTRQWIFKYLPDKVQVDRLIPFPGTPLTKRPQEYDLKWETQVDDEFFFRGRHNMDMHSFVSTSNLSVEQIDKFWKSLDEELREKGLSA
jgi:radical SAM superfamily enzyme YgiQ (UPF0313 family)